MLRRSELGVRVEGGKRGTDNNPAADTRSYFQCLKRQCLIKNAAPLNLTISSKLFINYSAFCHRIIASYSPKLVLVPPFHEIKRAADREKWRKGVKSLLGGDTLGKGFSVTPSCLPVCLIEGKWGFQRSAEPSCSPLCVCVCTVVARLVSGAPWWGRDRQTTKIWLSPVYSIDVSIRTQRGREGMRDAVSWAEGKATIRRVLTMPTQNPTEALLLFLLSRCGRVDLKHLLWGYMTSPSSLVSLSLLSLHPLLCILLSSSASLILWVSQQRERDTFWFWWVHTCVDMSYCVCCYINPGGGVNHIYCSIEMKNWVVQKLLHNCSTTS